MLHGLPEHASAAEDRFYIRALSSRVDVRTRVLKHGDTFAVFDRYGDVVQVGLGELGVYHDGTRFLSHLELRLQEERPLLLSSTVAKENTVVAVDLTNPDISDGGAIAVSRGTLHFARQKLLWEGVCHERLRVVNYGHEPVELTFAWDFDADFADIFEVRGLRRERRGRLLPAEVGPDGVTLAYEGLDGVVRRARFRFDPAPAALAASEARHALRLEPLAERAFELALACEVGRPPGGDGPGGAAARGGAAGAATSSPRPAQTGARPGGSGAGAPAAGRDGRIRSYAEALAETEGDLAAFRRDVCTLRTANPQFDEWLNRSLADLHLMITRTAHGPYPYAGVPWFSTAFGRDGILTALECLWLDPQLARGVLAFLAATQARERDAERDAEPGKILHEARGGEMAALREVPFGVYYGSVDATPLFVWLAGEHHARTGDLAFVDGLWPAVRRAVDWMAGGGDRDGDGFLEYARESREGLVHQGWKDSQDSVFHADGRDAEPPIALCEVQAYACAALARAAELAGALGREGEAAELAARSGELTERFRRAFWDTELGTFALALDGAKRACRVRASNAGHCLFAGVATPEQAAAAARTLLAPESFSGWGVRTLAAGQPRYNPMSYHNGSVWPHDNAIIAAGLARYGHKALAAQILDALFEASLFMDLHRLPELFCGFPRRPGEGPTLYPVACAPQAWAAGAPFLMLQAVLGLTVDGPGASVCFHRPILPAALPQLRIENLRVGEAEVDLFLQRHEHDVSVTILARRGEVEVRVMK